jgi:hypothetical protein
MFTRDVMLYNTMQERLITKDLNKKQIRKKYGFMEGLRNEVCLTVKVSLYLSHETAASALEQCADKKRHENADWSIIKY